MYKIAFHEFKRPRESWVEPEARSVSRARIPSVPSAKGQAHQPALKPYSKPIKSLLKPF